MLVINLGYSKHILHSQCRNNRMLEEDLWFRVKKQKRNIVQIPNKLQRNKKCTECKFGKPMFGECWRKYAENKQMHKLPWVCECTCSTFREFGILLQMMEMYAVSVLISQNIILSQELLFRYCCSLCGHSKSKLRWWLRSSFPLSVIYVASL